MTQDDAKKLLIIGNGFDLSLGLESSFSDFICKVFKSSIHLSEDYSDNFIEVNDQWVKSIFEFIYFNVEEPLLFGNKNDGGKFQRFLENYPIGEFNFWIFYSLLNKRIDKWSDIENNIYEFIYKSKYSATIGMLVDCFILYSHPSNYKKIFNNVDYKFMHTSELMM